MRIAVTGPESSGKTTLSVQLANVLNAKWVEEYAREYLMNLGRDYDFNDLRVIASGQFSKWEELHSEEWLICDTDMLVMKVWSEFKYGEVDPSILELVDKQQFDLFLLCKPDLPWEEDPLREHPEQRDELYSIYLRELESRSLPFRIIEGAEQERLSQALKFIEEPRTNR